ncbi:MAG: flavodoxin, partial [Porcipelethomonas sp.]
KTSSVSSEKAENSNVESTDTDEAQSNPANDTNSRILVAYFTMPEDGSDADAGASRVVTADGKVQGNVEYFANIIADETGADMFRIETAEQYPGTHDPLVDQAAEERDSGARPELSSHIENLDDYDTIFIGYPIWWYDMPMAMNTFFEEYDFGGKTIVPFSSHGGSGFSGTIDQMTEYEPNAKLLDGFTVSREDVPDSGDELKAWLSDLDL